MRLFTLVLPAILSLALADVIYANSHAGGATAHRRRRSSQTAENDRNLTIRSVSQLEKRFDNARFSFYAAGQGACGKTNSASDFIVALNSAQYNGGAHCFETITIKFGGKTTQAQIVDECPGCPFGGLDFSEGLFDFFSSEDAGIIYGEWAFGDSESVPKPTPKPSPSPSPSPKPSPTPSSSTTTRPLPSSSQRPTSSTTTISPSSALPTSTSSTTTTSPIASETAVAGPATLEQFNIALLGLAGIAVAGAQVID